MQVQGVLFDFNGTMFLDERFQERAWKQFFAEKFGIALSCEDLHERLYGRSAVDAFSYFLRRPVSLAEAAALEEEKETIYRRLCLEHPEQFHLTAGLPEFLDRLQSERVPMTIATASARPNVEFFFRELPLGRWFAFQTVVWNDGTFPGKPAPDIYLRAAEKLSVPIAGCVVFEDSFAGLQAAVRAGAARTIAVASSIPGETLLTLEGVSQVIADYRVLAETGLEPFLEAGSSGEKMP